jgi:hypothetical protein
MEESMNLLLGLGLLQAPAASIISRMIRDLLSSEEQAYLQ